MKLLDIINEDEDKLRKKIKTVYHALKKSTFIEQRSETNKVKIMYILPDQYKFTPTSHGSSEVPSVIINRRDVNFYSIQPNGEAYHLEFMSQFERTEYLSVIKTKFNHFNINLSTVE